MSVENVEFIFSKMMFHVLFHRSFLLACEQALWSRMGSKESGKRKVGVEEGEKAERGVPPPPPLEMRRPWEEKPLLRL